MSANGKHIPGPWRVEELATCMAVSTGSGDIRDIQICQVNGKGREEAVANARLIAAAPDLLEACKLAMRLPTLAIMSEEQSSSHFHGPRRAAEYDRKLRAALDTIEDATAKALYGEPHPAGEVTP
jgi:hypothetical protein